MLKKETRDGATSSVSDDAEPGGTPDTEALQSLKILLEALMGSTKLLSALHLAWAVQKPMDLRHFYLVSYS